MSNSLRTITSRSYRYRLVFLASLFGSMAVPEPPIRPRQRTPSSQCGTHYLHEIEYEFLATGSEDEQRLTGLRDEEASDDLDKPGGQTEARSGV